VPDCVAALDVGGTSMKGALVDADRAVRFQRTYPTPVSDGPDAVVRAIGDALADVSAQADGLDLNAPVAAGLVVPGVVDEVRGVAVSAANIGWHEVPLVPLMHDRLQLPVALSHDVRGGGLAEATMGAAAGARNSLFLALGTGIAACCIVDGATLSAGGYAGEAGHVVVEPGGEQCPCGQRGCLERVASAAAIARKYTQRSGTKVAGAAEVAERVRAGDEVAIQVWDEGVDALVRVLTMCVTMLGPEIVVLGGGLAEADDLLMDPVRTALDKSLTFQRHPRVVRATLGDQAGCLGAALLAWRTVAA
jgi:glucokinase